MLKCTISSTATALALAITASAPTAAQEVVSEPGNCAFFYPYGNCQNKGPGNPDTDPYFRRTLAVSRAHWSMGQPSALPRSAHGITTPRR
ncbi:hypothetical protein [Bradyrhizobium sp.]|uniref:hypothetical protein n=1 Tax=Bradyrhizobium sp. TaxID=376 RepID=UPI0025C1626A|nr:hypothetical protein [Bradyrhizobium sp.]MBV8921616.1 hypothetical protein [Bradyrhizobium sp.]